MPKQEKICPVCGISSKALHLHMRKHKGIKVGTTFKESAENIAEAISAPPEGQDIPLTPEIAEAQAEKEEVKNVNNCEYRLTLVLNGETLDCFTNNLKVSLLSYARPITTEGFITIRKGTAEFVKKMTLIQLKQLFADPQSLDIFLEGFYGLYGRPQTEQRLNNL